MRDTERICRTSGRAFIISELERELCRKFDVPLPDEHPEERMRRLLSFSNLTTLYQGRCAGSGERTLQIYRPGSVPFPVYSTPYWWSDNWEPLSYGREYDFGKPFFEQFRALRAVVPQMALLLGYTTVENCDYVCGASYCKNCYLVFNSSTNEDCLFCYTVHNCRDCLDCTSIARCELCSDCTACEDCYDVRHAFNCRNCSSSALLWNCIGCRDCFGCVNLRRKRFCFMNEQLSEAAYREKIASIAWDSHRGISRLKRQFSEFAKKFPQPAVRGVQFEQSSGDFISRSRNAVRCFEGYELHDCANTLKTYSAKDSLDYYSWGEGVELVYRTSRCGYDSSNIRCSYLVFSGCADIEYSMSCIRCRSCFGCIGLRNKEYCILNKQYTKDEYRDLHARIVAQMKSAAANGGRAAYGDYFPYDLSLFPVNDADVQLQLPMSAEEAAARGAWWAEKPEQEVAPTASWDDMPDRTQEAGSELFEQVFACTASGEPYRIIRRELEEYRRRKLPLPREHWRTRMLERQKMIGPPRLYRRSCDATGAPIESSFPPESGWQVWDSDVFVNRYGS